MVEDLSTVIVRQTVLFLQDMDTDTLLVGPGVRLAILRRHSDRVATTVWPRKELQDEKMLPVCSEP